MLRAGVEVPATVGVVTATVVVVSATVVLVGTTVVPADSAAVTTASTLVVALPADVAGVSADSLAAELHEDAAQKPASIRLVKRDDRLIGAVCLRNGQGKSPKDISGDLRP
jgi:hypothetical protein